VGKNLLAGIGITLFIKPDGGGITVKLLLVVHANILTLCREPCKIAFLDRKKWWIEVK
jgi:hypothetical protein